jgi:hypothetical protein
MTGNRMFANEYVYRLSMKQDSVRSRRVESERVPPTYPAARDPKSPSFIMVGAAQVLLPVRMNRLGGNLRSWNSASTS